MFRDETLQGEMGRDGYSQLPDGEWILTEVLMGFKQEYPQTYWLLITQGLSVVGI